MGSQTITRRAYWQGVRDGLPFLLVVVPFAMLFGLAATEAGLALHEVMAMTVLVFAGAAQFAALAMMEDGAPVLIVLVSALAVNLRMAMYSASLSAHFREASLFRRALLAYMLVDQSYAASMIRFETGEPLPMRAKYAYYVGTVTPVVVPWYLATWAGAVAGQAIPPGFALDFALPITFIALIAPMLRTRAHLATAFVSVAGTLALGFLPYNTGLLVAAVAAMIVGARIERMTSEDGR